MSDAISRRIKQLENQNQKFKKLLESTLQITSADEATCFRLKNEANVLRKAVSDLENQKRQLEDELNLYLAQDCGKSGPNVSVNNIQNKLNNALNDIQRESTELQQLNTEDAYLRSVILELEQEKETLLKDIRSVKRANAENNALAQENLKLKQELALLESNCRSNTSYSSTCSGQDLVQKLASLENIKQNLLADIRLAKQSSDPLGIPIENTVLELKILGIEKQKENILKNLRARLLQSANEVSSLHSDSSDGQLRGLLNELDIHKTILMMNLSDVKERYVLEEKENCENDIDDTSIQMENIKDDTLNIEPAEDPLPLLNQEINIKRFLSSDNEPTNQANEPSLAEPDRSQPKQSSSFPCNSSEVIQHITEIREAENYSEHTIETISKEDLCRYDQESHDLPTVSEEDEVQNELLAEHEQLKKEINRLELEREELLVQIQYANSLASSLRDNNRNRLLNLETRNQLHGTFMKEESSEEVHKLPLDDATNQLFGNEEQLLAQRIRELEEDNYRIRRDLSLMLEEDKEDLEVLEEGERLIKDHKGEVNEDVDPLE